MRFNKLVRRKMSVSKDEYDQSFHSYASSSQNSHCMYEDDSFHSEDDSFHSEDDGIHKEDTSLHKEDTSIHKEGKGISPSITFEIGDAVEVYWVEDDAYYEGKVSEYCTSKGWYIEYKDGDAQWEQKNIRLMVDAVKMIVPKAYTPVGKEHLQPVLFAKEYKNVLPHLGSTIEARPYTEVGIHAHVHCGTSRQTQTNVS